MTKATLTYTKEIVLDLTDPDVIETLTPFLQDVGADGMATVEQLHNAIKACIDEDPDMLIPRLDDIFDSNDITIAVDPAMAEESNAISVEPAKDDE